MTSWNLGEERILGVILKTTNAADNKDDFVNWRDMQSLRLGESTSLLSLFHLTLSHLKPLLVVTKVQGSRKSSKITLTIS